VNTDALFYTLCKETPRQLDDVLSLPEGDFVFDAPVFKAVEKRADAVFIPLQAELRPRLHEFYNYKDDNAFVDAVVKACLYAEKNGVLPHITVVFARRSHVPQDPAGLVKAHDIRVVVLDRRSSNPYVQAVLWAAGAAAPKRDAAVYRRLRRLRPDDPKYQRIIAYIMREKHSTNTGNEQQRGWDLSLSVEEIFMRSEGWLGEVLRKVARETRAQAEAEMKAEKKRLVEQIKKTEAQRKKAEAKAEAQRKKAEAKAEAQRKKAEAKVESEKIAVARRMLAEGMDPQTVAKITRMPPEKFLPAPN
jgi:hypothetical protein